MYVQETAIAAKGLGVVRYDNMTNTMSWTLYHSATDANRVVLRGPAEPGDQQNQNGEVKVNRGFVARRAHGD